MRRIFDWFDVAFGSIISIPFVSIDILELIQLHNDPEMPAKGTMLGVGNETSIASECVVA